MHVTPNRRKSSVLLIVLSFIIIAIFSRAAQAYTSDIEKEKQEEVTLYWGDKATFRNYSIEAFSFTGEKSSGIVRLKLYKDGVFVDERILSSSGGETWNTDDEIWIDITGFYIDPAKEAYVKLGVTLRGLPVLSLEVNTDADSYYADRDILLSVKLKNEGSNSTPSGAKAGDVKLNITAEGLQVISGEAIKSYYEIKRSEELPEIKLTLKAPSLMERTAFTINATCTGYDAKNKQYIWTASKQIYIDSAIEIRKTVAGGYIDIDSTPTPTDTDVDDWYYLEYGNSGQREPSAVTEMYIDEDALVNILITNHGDSPLNNIKINDSITSDFTLKSGTTSFEVNVTPREQKNIFYSITPKRVGTYTLPKMTANLSYQGKNYHIESDQVSITVHGPLIDLKKTVNKNTALKGETVKVTVEATNFGDRTCMVNITDDLPGNTRLMGGNLTAIAILKTKESVSTSYEIMIEGEGAIILPNATSRYEDIRQYRASANSNSLTINVPIPTSLPTATPAALITPAPAEEPIKPEPEKTVLPLRVTEMQWPLWIDVIAGLLIGILAVYLIWKKPLR